MSWPKHIRNITEGGTIKYDEKTFKYGFRPGNVLALEGEVIGNTPEGNLITTTITDNDVLNAVGSMLTARFGPTYRIERRDLL